MPLTTPSRPTQFKQSLNPSSAVWQKQKIFSAEFGSFRGVIGAEGLVGSWRL